MASSTTIEPVGMRPADNRFAGGRVGEYHYKGNGRPYTVWMLWVPTSQTHTDIVVWDADRVLEIREDVVRVQAPAVSEQMLEELLG